MAETLEIAALNRWLDLYEKEQFCDLCATTADESGADTLCPRELVRHVIEAKDAEIARLQAEIGRRIDFDRRTWEWGCGCGDVFDSREKFAEHLAMLHPVEDAS